MDLTESGKMELWSAPVLSPVGKMAPMVTKLAQRLTSLEGKTIGLYDNHKPGADIALEAAQEVLSEKYGVKEFIKVVNDHHDLITDSQLRGMMEADAVLVASAD
jgi:hypothetical protein